MPTKAPPKWLKYVGYPAFFLLATLLFIHLTLPYDMLKARAVDEARAQGYELSMVSLGPSLFFGVTAKGVMLSTPQPTASAGPDAPPASAVLLDSVTVRPGLLPPGLHISANAFGGSVDAFIANKTKGNLGIEVTARDLELARAGLKPLVGLDMQGKLRADADLTVNPLDLSKTVGTIKVSGKELVLNGGTVNYVDLPKANLGALDIRLKADQGKAAIEAFGLTGGDVEAKADGNLLLGNRFNTSSVNAKVEFKPNDEWLKKYSFIQTGLHLAGHPNRDGFYTATLSGILLNPRANLQ